MNLVFISLLLIFPNSSMLFIYWTKFGKREDIELIRLERENRINYAGNRSRRLNRRKIAKLSAKIDVGKTNARQGSPSGCKYKPMTSIAAIQRGAYNFSDQRVFRIWDINEFH